MQLPYFIRVTVFVGLLLVTNLVKLSLAQNPYPMTVTRISGGPIPGECSGSATVDGSSTVSCWQLTRRMKLMPDSGNLIAAEKWTCALRTIDPETGTTTTSYPPLAHAIACSGAVNVDGDLSTGVGKVSLGGPALHYDATANTVLIVNRKQLRSIDLSTSVISTLAGTENTGGTTNGIGTAATFGQLDGPAVLPSGILVFVDIDYRKFRFFDPSTNEMGHFAGGGQGYQEGIDTAILIGTANVRETDLWMFNSTHMVFNDAFCRIRMLNVDTKESFYIAGSQSAGENNSPQSLGVASSSTFSAFSMAVWGDKVLIVDYLAHCLLELYPVSPEGTVRCILGTCGTSATTGAEAEGTEADALLWQPMFLIVGPTDETLYLMEANMYVKITMPPTSKTGTHYSATQTTTITPPDTRSDTLSLTHSVSDTLSLQPTMSDTVSAVATPSETRRHRSSLMGRHNPPIRTLCNACRSFHPSASGFTTRQGT